MSLFFSHPASKSLSLASRIVLLSVTLLVSACETTGFSTLSGSGEVRAERLADNGRHSDAAGIYIGLASDAIGAEQDRLTLLAVEQWLDAGDTVRARRAFESVVRPTANPLLSIWNTNAAAFSLYEGDADAALALLEPMSRQPLGRRDRLRVEALRADAWIQKSDPARAVELMMQRESWIDDSRGKALNRERLWQGLLVSRADVLRTAAQNSQREDIRAWLSVASLAVTTGQQGIGWQSGITKWRDTNPRHPANDVFDDMVIGDFEELTYPRQVAVLLPLSGRSAAAGQAVQNGFLGAYFATANELDTEEQQTVRVYDVNAEGGASAAYQNAVEDGADFVFGPLLRKNVTELANDILVPVPVLTLNDLQEESLAPPGLYQFALAPEDEAASAAQRAMSDGHTRAVALVPNNDWGRRVL